MRGARTIVCSGSFCIFVCKCIIVHFVLWTYTKTDLKWKFGTVLEQEGDSFMKSKSQVCSNKLVRKGIPYLRCFEEAGMIETEKGVFSRCYRIMQPEGEMKHGFSSRQARVVMENILRKLSERFAFQFVIRNSYMEQDEYLKAVELKAPGGADEYREVRENYNAVLRENCGTGHNNFSRRVYLTISTQADTPEDAGGIFEASDQWIRELFAELYGFRAEGMCLTDRLRLLYEIYNPEVDAPVFGSRVDYDGKGFSIQSMQRMRATTKEVIAPDRYECGERDCLKVGGFYVRVFFINSLPASVPDSILNDLASASSNSILSVSYEPMDAAFGLDVAAELVRKNTFVRDIPVRETVADRRMNRTRRQEETVRDTEEEYFYKSALGVFKRARARQEPVLQASFVVALYAGRKEELDRNSELLKLTAAKYAGQIRCLDLQQNEGFQSVLPLNNVKVNVKRIFTIEQLAALQPLDVPGAYECVRTFYGLNAINDNLILLDRKNYVTALIAGMERMGKSFALRREVVNTLLATGDDVAVLTRYPEEYQGFAAELNGYFYPDFHPDIFGKGGNYNLNDDKRVFQKIFLEAYLAVGIGEHKGKALPEELKAGYEQGEREAERLCGIGSMEEAVLFAKENPLEVPLFIRMLGQGSFTVDRFILRSRLSVFGYGNDAELLARLDFLWDYAVEAKKRNRTLWIFVDPIDPLLYVTPGSDYLISLLERAEKLEVPVTMVVQDAVHIVTDESAMIELDYLMGAVKFFRLFSMGPVERKYFTGRLNIAEQLVPYLVERGAGEGVIVTPSANIAFNDHFEEGENSFYRMFYSRGQ